jgi:hypothetical protein
MSVKTWKAEDFKIRYEPGDTPLGQSYVVDYPDGDTHYRVSADEVEQYGLRILLPNDAPLHFTMSPDDRPPYGASIYINTLVIPAQAFRAARTKAQAKILNAPSPTKAQAGRDNARRAMRAFPNLLTDNEGYHEGIGPEVQRPCDCDGRDTVASTIMHLNDLHGHEAAANRWTRERIADWLDMLHSTGQVDLSVHWEEEKA